MVYQCVTLAVLLPDCVGTLAAVVTIGTDAVCVLVWNGALQGHAGIISVHFPYTPCVCICLSFSPGAYINLGRGCLFSMKQGQRKFCYWKLICSDSTVVTMLMSLDSLWSLSLSLLEYVCLTLHTSTLFHHNYWAQHHQGGKILGWTLKTFESFLHSLRILMVLF